MPIFSISLFTSSLATTIFDLPNSVVLNSRALITDCFDPLRAHWYTLSARTNDPELVFHRRQLLLLMKLAIEYCPEVGLEILRVPRYNLGSILLMANDQFHYGLYPAPGVGSMDDLEKVSRVLAEMVPVTEYGGFRIENWVTRFHILVTEYVARLKGHPDYIDIATEYERQTGIDFADYEALTFGLFARFSSVSLADLRANAAVVAVRPENFDKTSIARDRVDRFLSEFCLTPGEAVARIDQARKKKQDYGANDFTVFRDRPLLTEVYGRIPTDSLLVIEKFSSGPYWRINSISRDTGNKLRRFWGAIFEAYVNDQIADGANRSGARFLPNPRLAADSNIQLCDGILVEGNSLVLLEYKSSMFSARAKYSGDHVLLRDEIATKLVRDEAENHKKGVQQLADAVDILFKDPNQKVIAGLDIKTITHVYPLLVTLDDLGGTLLISRLLNLYFDKFLDRPSFAPIQIRPAFCTDIESLEIILPYLDLRPLSSFLQYWYEHDNKLAATILAHVPDGLPARRNNLLDKEWKQLHDEILARLFPDEHSAAKAQEQQ